MKGVLHVMPPYQFWGKDLVMGFPSVVRFRISLPLDKVLKFAPSAMTPVVLNGLDLIFLFAVDYFWWRFHKVDPVFFCFAIRSQQAGMEYIMDGPGGGKLELISDW